MKKILAPILLPLLCGLAFAETVPSADNPEQAHADSFKKRFASDLRHPPESEARLNKWFRDGKFGVFIHFGAYSTLAGQYKGNFGGCAAIAEMLMQSHAGKIELLPALPDAWPEGKVRGLRARGGFEVDIEWKDGKVTNFRLAASKSQPVQVRVNGEVKTVNSEVLN